MVVICQVFVNGVDVSFLYRRLVSKTYCKHNKKLSSTTQFSGKAVTPDRQGRGNISFNSHLADFNFEPSEILYKLSREQAFQYVTFASGCGISWSVQGNSL